MTADELAALPRAELNLRAIQLGLGSKILGLPPAELARAMLVRLGEAASAGAWGTAALLQRVDALHAEVSALRIRVGKILERLERRSARALALSEAVLMTKARRAPTPAEIGLLSTEALRHLAASLQVGAVSDDNSILGAPTRLADTDRAGLLDSIAEKLSWRPWLMHGEESFMENTEESDGESNRENADE